MEINFEKAAGAALIVVALLIPSCVGITDVNTKNKNTQLEIERAKTIAKIVEHGSNPLEARCAVYYNEPMCSIRASK